jgi:hypothetical protein
MARARESGEGDAKDIQGSGIKEKDGARSLIDGQLAAVRVRAHVATLTRLVLIALASGHPSNFIHRPNEAV